MIPKFVKTCVKCAIHNYVDAWHRPHMHKALIIGHGIGTVALLAGIFGFHSVSNLLDGSSLALVIHHHMTTPEA